jgi:hypothetical protein
MPANLGDGVNSMTTNLNGYRADGVFLQTRSLPVQMPLRYKKQIYYECGK